LAAVVADRRSRTRADFPVPDSRLYLSRPRAELSGCSAV
jgi:hypothetical protein